LGPHGVWDARSTRRSDLESCVTPKTPGEGGIAEAVERLTPRNAWKSCLCVETPSTPKVPMEGGIIGGVIWLL
jgi:hypothetical protein